MIDRADLQHGSAAPEPALAGRCRELARLRTCLASAVAGAGAVVLVSGEAGAGKTALVASAVGAGLTPPPLVLGGSAGEHSRPPALELWRGVAEPVGGWLAEPAAHRRPMVIVLDNLQWADPESLALLGRLAPRVGDLPLLLVAVHRTEELTTDLAELLPALVHRARAVRVHL